jgi:hypothetical protein
MEIEPAIWHAATDWGRSPFLTNTGAPLKFFAAGATKHLQMCFWHMVARMPEDGRSYAPRDRRGLDLPIQKPMGTRSVRQVQVCRSTVEAPALAELWGGRKRPCRGSLSVLTD